MEKALKLWLLKLQAVPGTPEVALDATDYIEATEDSSGIAADIQSADIALSGNGYGHDLAVQGRRLVNAGLTFPLREEQAAHIPGFVKALQCARFAMTENAGFFELVPSNTVEHDCTIWEYSGNLNAGASLVSKAGNVKFGGKLSFDFGGDCYAKMELTGNGLEIEPPSNSSQPTVVKDGSVIPSLKNVATFTLNGSSSYRVLTLDIDFGQEIAVSVLPSVISGCGKAHVTNRKITWSAKVYRELTTTVDPIVDQYASNPGALSLVYGASNGIDLSCPSVTVRKVANSEENGIESWDLEGQVLNNDLLLKIAGSSI